MAPPKRSDQYISQVLNINLTTALSVAGPADERSRPTRLKKAALHRATGLARSTFNDLLEACANGTANPDLRTLCLLADALHIPVAFLLMGQSEWNTLMKAFSDVLNAGIREAALKQQGITELNKPQSALQILRDLKAWPTKPPAGRDSADALKLADLARENEALRRATLVTAAMMQAGQGDARSDLTMLAAAHANQDRSRHHTSL